MLNKKSPWTNYLKWWLISCLVTGMLLQCVQQLASSDPDIRVSHQSHWLDGSEAGSFPSDHGMSCCDQEGSSVAVPEPTFIVFVTLLFILSLWSQAYYRISGSVYLPADNRQILFCCWRH